MNRLALKLKSILGKEPEYDYIVSDFNRITTRLTALAGRKQKAAENLDNEIAAKLAAKGAAESTARRATATAAKIRELIG